MAAVKGLFYIFDGSNKSCKTMRLLLLCGLLFCSALIFAQTEKSEDKKEVKKMVIIKKTVDADGNETTERIEKELTDEDVMIWTSEDGTTTEVRKKRIFITDEAMEDAKMLKGEDGDEHVEVRVYQSLDELPEDLRQEIGDIDVSEDAKTRIRVMKMDDGDKTIELKEGEELPEEVRKKLEAAGVDVQELDGKKQVRIITREVDMDVEVDDEDAKMMRPDPNNTLELETLNLNLNSDGTNSDLTLEFTAPKVPTSVVVTDAEGNRVFVNEYPKFDGKFKEVIRFAGESSRGGEILIRQSGKSFREVLR